MSPEMHSEVMDARRRLDGLGSVVVATELTPGARVALERTARLPSSLGARIELAHVVGLNESEALVGERLAEERERFFGSRGDVVTSILHGNVAFAVASRARHARAELIVLGRHGARTWRDAILGTTAEHIVRDGSTSTLVVATTPAGPYRRPLVAVDFSPSAGLALELAARITERDASICAMHVVQLEEYLLDHPAVALTSDAECRRETARADGLAQLQRFLDASRIPASWRPAVHVGDPAAWILASVAQRNSDLVVVGSTGKGLFKRALLGSVAERILRDAPCDVLVARLPEVRERRSS